MSRPLILAPFVLLLGCSNVMSSDGEPAGAAPRPIPMAVDAKLAQGPEGTYSRTCGYCHGTNVGPILLGKGYPPEAITYMVRNGKGAMPAFRPTEISEAELQALSKWVSTSTPSTGDQGK